MDKFEQRRLALIALVKSFGRGGSRIVAEAIGRQPSYISRLISTPDKDGHRKIKDEIFDALTSAFPGWLADPNSSSILSRTAARIRPKSGEVAFYVLDAHAACGDGALNADYPEIVRALVMTEAEARKLVGSLNKTGSIQVILASGDSMTPTIQPRDLLFVDTHLRDYRGEGVYLLLHGQELLCKRLSMVGRILTVSSDNKRTPSWAWKDRLEDDRIIGRVVCVLPMNFTRL